MKPDDLLRTGGEPIPDTEQAHALDDFVDETAEEIKATAKALDKTVADEKAKAAQLKIDRESAAAFLAGGLDMANSALQASAPHLSIPDAQRDNIADKGAAVAVKYGTTPPPFIAKYMEEILLVGALGGLGFTLYMQQKAFETKIKIETINADRKAKGLPPLDFSQPQQLQQAAQ